MLGDVADVVTLVKFGVNRFRGFGVSTLPILEFSIGLADRPYNSASTSVLYTVISLEISQRKNYDRS